MKKDDIAQAVYEAIGKGEGADKLVALLSEIAGVKDKPEKEGKGK